MGIDSSIIGQGADIIICDDVSNPADNNSEISRKNVIDTYSDVIFSRLNDNKIGIRIILQQRVHENDLCGYLLQHNPEEYDHICLPVELTKDTTESLKQYYIDGLFWTTRFSREEILNYQKQLSPQGFSSQLLQSPTALEGTILQRSWFKIIRESEYIALNKNDNDKKQNVLFLDTAYTSNEANDPSAMLLCQLINGKIYIHKVQSKHLEFYELIQEILEWIKIYNIKKCYIEQKATGISILQELRRLLRGNISILGLDAGSKSKNERTQSIQPFLINNKVVLVEGGWNAPFLDQCANFPYARHDDQVDCLTYAVVQLLSKTWHPVNKENQSGSGDTFFDSPDLYR
jgi:predicted phage terminase large subunit-like protein